MMAFALTSLHADILYVKAEAVGSGDGTSWETATTLDDALSLAFGGDIILVAKGEYRGNYYCTKGVKVYGSCEGTETEPPVYTFADVSNLGTKLIGKADGKRVLTIDHTDAEWSGFDISGGDASLEVKRAGGGGGVNIHGEGGILSYCRVHNNIGLDGDRRITSAPERPLKGYGGGVYAWKGIVRYCIIEDNVAVKNGWSNTAGSIHSNGSGGGVVLGDWSTSAVDRAELHSSIVRGNTTVTGTAFVSPGYVDWLYTFPNFGGGVTIRGGAVVNCLVVGNFNTGGDNTQNVGGGIAVAESGGFPCHIINCTVAGNVNRGPGGGIGYQTQNTTSNIIIANCALFGNAGDTRDTPPAVQGTRSQNIRYAMPETMGSSTLSITSTIWPEATAAEVAAGNIAGDPKFKSFDYVPLTGDPNGVQLEKYKFHMALLEKAKAATADFSLQEGSPAIDAGDEPPLSAYLTLPDVAGSARIFGDAVDMGAYEFGSETGIGDIIADANDPVVSKTYYNLLGVKVDQPESDGIYIVKNVHASKKESTSTIFFQSK